MRGKPLHERFWAKVDKTETCWNWTAGKDGKGYGWIKSSGKLTSAHRLSYTWAHGPIPDRMVIDHMCHNHSCVNPAHLRAVTTKQNGENRSGAPSNSKSGIRGVTWDRDQKKWRAAVVHNGKYIRAGVFATTVEAEAAVKALRNELHTHNDLDRVSAA